LFVKPLSYLPFTVLYKLSDFFYLIIYYGLQYRKKVVFSNLKNSFPNKSPQEIKTAAKAFYRHFCDLLIESIKVFGISESAILERCRVINPELIQTYADNNQSLIIVAGHYNNWEMAAVALNLQIPHQAIVIYTPLKNKFIDQQIKQSRSKFGLALWSKRMVKKELKVDQNELRAVVFVSDQSPTIARTAYWTQFLHQETGVMVGAEKYAKQYAYPVVFGKVTKVKRGYYEIEFITLENQPQQTAFGQISEQHTRLLETIITEKPQYWLWSHKRWKKKRPVSSEQ
ncbi:MAG: lipid A biosynthesis acyltransferase, partial [Bacteroidota bacterium]